MSSNGLNSQSHRVVLYTYSWYTNVTYFGKTPSAVIALKYNEKHYRKKMFRLSFGDVLMKSVHKYKKVTKQIFIGYCNTVNIQLNWLQKKLFVGQ